MIRNADTAVFKEDKFLIDDGLVKGFIELPDSLLPGDYHFVAYSDLLVNNKPSLIFNQPVTIKKIAEPPIKAYAKIIAGNNSESDDNPRVEVSVVGSDEKILLKPAIVQYRYQKEWKKLLTDNKNQIIIELPTSSAVDSMLYMKILQGADSTFLTLNIPHPIDAKSIVNFYPGRGNLIEDLTSNVGWEVKDAKNNFVPALAYLYCNDSIIDTIET